MQDVIASIEEFLRSGPFAVVGASADPAKFGHRCLLAYRDRGMPVVGVHPTESEVAGVRCYADLGQAPDRPRSVSLVVPPAVTTHAVRRGLELGIRNFWMQPGAESREALDLIDEAGALAIANGPCVLVELARRDGPGASEV